MRTFILAIACALAACGPTSAEVKTAKTARYKTSPQELLQLAMEVTRQTYPIGAVDQEQAQFITLPKFYTAEGGTESAGADDVVMLRPGSIRLELIVQVVTGDDQALSVVVTPRSFQTVAGSPQPRELTPEDPSLPPWVLGRADALQLAIYNRAKPYAVAPPAGK